jgi:hypothetical protein
MRGHGRPKDGVASLAYAAHSCLLSNIEAKTLTDRR